VAYSKPLHSNSSIARALTARRQGKGRPEAVPFFVCGLIDLLQCRKLYCSCLGQTVTLWQ
jgi:hypothetical protein